MYDCLLCNPNLVKTGLDLLDFPIITTTTTLTTADVRSSQIRHELVIRGRVYVRGDSAVAYVEGIKLTLQSGNA